MVLVALLVVTERGGDDEACLVTIALTVVRLDLGTAAAR